MKVEIDYALLHSLVLNSECLATLWAEDPSVKPRLVESVREDAEMARRLLLPGCGGNNDG